MAIAFVQGATTGGVSGTYTNTAGNLLVASVVVFDGSYPSPNSVSDTRNGAWTRAVQAGDAPNVGTVEIWYRENCAAGSNTVTLGGLSGGAFTILNIAEYSGAATSGSLDKTAGRVQSNLTAPSTGAVTTTGTDLVLACVSCSQDDLTPGSGFALAASPSGGNPFEYKIQTSAGSVDGTFVSPGNNGFYGMVLAAFLPSGGAPPATTPSPALMLLGCGS